MEKLDLAPHPLPPKKINPMVPFIPVTTLETRVRLGRVTFAKTSGTVSGENLPIAGIYTLFTPQLKFCKSVVFNLFWDDRKTQDKLKTMVMQNFGGQTKCNMDNVTMLNWPLRGCAGKLCKDLLPRPSPPPFR